MTCGPLNFQASATLPHNPGGQRVEGQEEPSVWGSGCLSPRWLGAGGVPSVKQVNFAAAAWEHMIMCGHRIKGLQIDVIELLLKDYLHQRPHQKKRYDWLRTVMADVPAAEVGPKQLWFNWYQSTKVPGARALLTAIKPNSYIIVCVFTLHTLIFCFLNRDPPPPYG